MPNLFEHLPDNLDQEVFESILESDQVRIERIVSKGHSSPETGWYDQHQHEWVTVLRGAGVLEFETGEEIRLNAGDYIHLLPHQRHRVAWTDPEQETVWLAIHF